MIMEIYILVLVFIINQSHSSNNYNNINSNNDNFTVFDCAMFINPIIQQRDICFINASSLYSTFTNSVNDDPIVPTIDLCVSFNGEYEFILPFLIHHLSIGIQHIIIYNNDILVEWYKYPAIECLLTHQLIELKHHIWDEDFEHNTYKPVKAMNRCYRKDIPDIYENNPSFLHTWGIFLDINDMIVLHHQLQQQQQEHDNQHYPRKQCMNELLLHAKASISVAMYIAEFVKYEVAVTNTSYITSLQGILLPYEIQLHRKIRSSHFKQIVRTGCVNIWNSPTCLDYLSYCESEFNNIITDTLGNTLSIICSSNTVSSNNNNTTTITTIIPPNSNKEANRISFHNSTTTRTTNTILAKDLYKYVQISQYVILPHHHNDEHNKLYRHHHHHHITTTTTTTTLVSTDSASIVGNGGAFKSHTQHNFHNNPNPTGASATVTETGTREAIETVQLGHISENQEMIPSSERVYYLAHHQKQANPYNHQNHTATLIKHQIHQQEKYYRNHKQISDYSFQHIYGAYLNQFKTLCKHCFNTTEFYLLKEYRSNAQSKKWPCESECTAGLYRHTNTCIPTCWDQPMYESMLVSNGCHVVLYTVSFYQNATRLNHVSVNRYKNTLLDSYRGEARLPYHHNHPMDDLSLNTTSSTSTTSEDRHQEGVKVCAIAFIAANSILSQILRRNNTGYYENWAVIEVDLYSRHRESTERSLGNARKISRLPKLSPGFFFASTVHHALYIDSKLEFVEDPLTMLNFKSRRVYDRKLKKKTNNTAVFLAVRHELSNNIYEEVEAIFKVRRTFSRSVTFYPYELRHQTKHYRQLGRELNMSYINIFEGAVLLHDLKSIVGYNFRCMWYKEYLLWADRDQISGGYAIANSARIVRNTSSSTPQSRNETVKEWIPLGRDPITNELQYARLLIPYTYYWGSAYHKRHNFVRIKAGSWHDNLYVPVDHTKVKVEI